MCEARRVADAALAFYYKDVKVPETGDNGRYRSWEHCYLAFREAREERRRNGGLSDGRYDHLCLHLAFYLASWGMYRGSSFLLKLDYKIHEGAVKEILHEKYDPLQGTTCKILKNNIGLLFDLDKTLRKFYLDIRVGIKDRVKNGVSDTLITKVLMGTLGCVPAYDRFFLDTIKAFNIKPACFSQKSIQALADFYGENETAFEGTRDRLRIHEGGVVYPQMKFLDMGFWQIGKDADDRKRANKKETQQ